MKSFNSSQPLVRAKIQQFRKNNFIDEKMPYRKVSIVCVLHEPITGTAGHSLRKEDSYDRTLAIYIVLFLYVYCMVSLHILRVPDGEHTPTFRQHAVA